MSGLRAIGVPFNDSISTAEVIQRNRRMIAIFRVILQRLATEMLFCFNLALIITVASTFQYFLFFATATQLKHAELKKSNAFDHTYSVIYLGMSKTYGEAYSTLSVSWYKFCRKHFFYRYMFGELHSTGLHKLV
jgi:hypothetical protein